MKNESRIVELLAEMVKNQDLTNQKIDHLTQEMRGVKEEVHGMKEEIFKLNLNTSENTRAIISMADRIEGLGDHEGRIKALEKEVFKK